MRTKTIVEGVSTKLRCLGWLLLAAGTMLTACDATPAEPPSQRRPQSALTDQQNQRRVRELLLAELQTVTLQNCVPKRVGSANDGGYVLCDNLIQGVQTVYSYGIGGNDDWGCEMSSRFNVPVHQYDCFNPPNVSCPGGQFVPHNECVGTKAETIEGRTFDSIVSQMERNGDRGKQMIVKIDVEGAEWDALLATPEEVLAQIDQLPMELHGVGEPRFLEAVQKLKRHFYLVHLHFNNWSCAGDIEPFPAHAYQVLFVNKRVGVLGAPPAGVASPSSLDAPDNPRSPDCQPTRAQE
jgi:hypothetical protein